MPNLYKIKPNYNIMVSHWKMAAEESEYLIDMLNRLLQKCK